VALFDWQQKPRLSLKLRLPLLDKLRRSLIYWGWFKPRRDFGAFHRALAARGLLGDTPPKNAVADDLARVVTRIRQLMAQRDKAQTRYNTEN
jgi:hypothetical protein